MLASAMRIVFRRAAVGLLAGLALAAASSLDLGPLEISSAFAQATICTTSSATTCPSDFTSGNVGDPLIVVGDWPVPNDSITILVGNSFHSSCTSASSGANAYVCTGVVPTVSRGSKNVQALGTDDSALTTFTVNPKVSNLNVASGSIGTSVTVSGSGYPNSTVSPAATLGGIATADPGGCSSATNGNASCTVVVPTGLTAGTYAFTLTLNGFINTNTTASAPNTFAVTPRISNALGSGFVGSSLTVSGDGFAAGQQIQVQTDAGSFSNLSGCISSGTGAISGCSYTIPALTNGSHTITLTDGTNTTSAASFTVNAKVTSLTNASGFVGDTVIVAGTGYANSGSFTATFNSTSVTPTSCAVDADGNLSGCQFTVPAAPVGARLVTLSRNSVANTNSISFTVSSRITDLSASTGTIGTTITVSGTGYSTSASNPAATLGGVATAAPSGCSAASNGNASCSVIVPNGLVAGTYGFTLTLNGFTNANTTAAAPNTFALTPRLSTALGSGFVGSTLTVNGDGFAGLLQLQVNTDGGSFSTLTGCVTNSTGAVSACTYTIGSLINGAHTLTLTDGTNSTSAAPFTVNAKITALTGPSGFVGDTVTVSGTGYPDTGSFTGTFNGASVTPSGCSVDADGNLSGCLFTVPTAPAGARVVTVSRNDIANTNSISFTVGPRITSTLGSVVKGSTQSISGNGFAASSVIQSSTSDGDYAALSGGCTSSSSGVATCSYVVSVQLSAGSQTLKLRDAALNETPALTFTATTTSAAFELPRSVVLDSQGNVWVADAENARVLRFPSTALSDGAITDLSLANLVVGQADVSANTPGTSSQLLSKPTGLTFDKLGNLYVVDQGNHRVLKFLAASLTSNGPAAAGLLGQGDFISGSANRGGAADATTLSSPTAVAVDSSSFIYVADTGNHRVLRYAATAVTATGGAATGILGQVAYSATSANQGGSASATSLSGPQGLAVDPKKNLYVADTGNHRVLFYSSSVVSKPGSAAAAVIGQASLTSSGSGTTDLTLKSPAGVALDNKQNVYVADTGNHRVLRYPGKSVTATGAAPTALWGQDDFTGGSSGSSSTSLSNPRSIAVDSKANLYIADSSNNRVMRNMVFWSIVQPSTVILAGSGFGSSPTVSWGSTTISSTTLCTTSLKTSCIKPGFSNTKISLSPPAALSNVTPAVTVNGSTSPVSTLLDNKYYYGPLLTGLTPQSGINPDGSAATSGGTAVTITGKNFSRTTRVQFGNATLTKCATDQVIGCVANTGSTSLSIYTPTSTAAGSTSPTVTIVGGSVNTAFTDNVFHYDKPVVTDVSPLTGSAAGGTPVTITGVGIWDGLTTSIQWSGSPDITELCSVASDPTKGCIKRVGNGKITLLSPSNTGSATITVTVSGKSGTVSSVRVDNTFRYATAVLTALTPQSGPTDGGTLITLAGVGFGSSPTVDWGDTTLTQSCAVAPDPRASCLLTTSPASITLYTPPGTTGDAISVTVNGGVASTKEMDNTFHYGKAVLTTLK